MLLEAKCSVSKKEQRSHVCTKREGVRKGKREGVTNVNFRSGSEEI